MLVDKLINRLTTGEANKDGSLFFLTDKLNKASSKRREATEKMQRDNSPPSVVVALVAHFMLTG